MSLTNRELESCNLGYARSCPRLPATRAADAVRFSVLKECAGTISLQFVLESAYRPGDHGTLEFNQESFQWKSVHPDQHIQKLAECFLQSYLERKKRI